MQMATKTAASVKAKAAKTKKKKITSTSPSDEEELSPPAKKPNRGAAPREETSASSEAEASTASDDAEEEQIHKSSQKHSQEEETVQDEPKTKTNYATEEDDMSTEFGPWAFMLDEGHKGNATQVQRSIVPWCISIFGLNYRKNVTLDAIKEMVLALCASNGWVSCNRRKSITSLLTTSPSESKRLQVCCAKYFV